MTVEQRKNWNKPATQVGIFKQSYTTLTACVRYRQRSWEVESLYNVQIKVKNYSNIADNTSRTLDSACFIIADKSYKIKTLPSKVGGSLMQ
jgi:hypothetical protein